jgi:excisionase family DNA binding protein
MSTKEDFQRWMTSDEVAEYLKVERDTIYHFIKDARIPHHKIPGGQRLRFDRYEIDKWMESGRVETIADLSE